LRNPHNRNLKLPAQGTLIDATPTHKNAAKAGQFVLHKIPVYLSHNLSEAESCLCIFAVDVSKAATLIGNVFRTYVRDLGVEKTNTQGDIVLRSNEENFWVYVESRGTARGAGVVRPPPAAECKGSQNERQMKKDYFLTSRNFKII
jgi:hypothetical protein